MEEEYKIITLTDGRQLAQFPNGNIVPMIMGGSGADEGTTTDSTDGNATGDNPDGGNNGETKVVFDQAQQEKVQALIDDNYKKAYAKAEAAAEKKVTATVNAEVTKTLNEIEANKKKSDTKGVIDQEQLDQVREQLETAHSETIEALQSKLDNLSDKDKDNALLLAIGKHDVFNPAQVMRLISDNVQMGEKGEVLVVDDNGNTKLGTDLKPMSLDDFVNTWLNDNLNMRKGSNGGAGSHGSMGNGNGKIKLNTLEDWRNLSREQRDEVVDSGTLKANIGGQIMDIKKTTNPFQAPRQRKHQKQRERN